MTKITVFSHRWGHSEDYGFDRIATGWHLTFLTDSGDCDKTGAPYLFKNLDHDSINYPKDLGGYLEWLWNKADEQSMSDADIQQHLDEIGNWIQQVEMASPVGGVWSGLMQP